jgi:hypothetical protein
MSEDLTTGSSAPAAICPWCSSPLGPADTETCSSCGATLRSEAEANLPGLTAIDPLAVLEGTKEPRRPKNRWVAWLTGDDIDEAANASPGSAEALSPPPLEVRREILRLEVEAALTQRAAEVESLATDEAVALDESGDSAAAHAAVAAILGSDQEIDELVESPEEAHLAVASGAAEPPPASPDAGSEDTGDSPPADDAADPSAEDRPADG